MGSFFFGKKNLLLLAGSAITTLAATRSGKVPKEYHSAAVGILKEGYAFKEWVCGKLEKLKEDAEDIAAEAVYEYQSDLDSTADLKKRERELLEKIEKIVEKKLTETHPE